MRPASIALLWFAVAMLACLPRLAQAHDGASIAGWLEKATFDGGKHLVKAKLDSGARTSSINAEKIERFDRDDERWVRFELVLKTVDGEEVRKSVEKPLVRNVKIKEHKGKFNRRPVVMLDFCMDQTRYEAQFTLVDRSRFNYPVLLGRRFLVGHYAIDPAKTYLTQPSCEAQKPE